MSTPAGVWILSVLLAVLVSTSADSQVEEVVCGVADLKEDGSEYIKPFTCDNLGGAAPVQPDKLQIPPEEFPWIGILSLSTSNEKTCLGVIISQDLVVASQPCEISASYTFEISHLNFISDLSVVPPKAGVNSENDMLVFKLATPLPPDIYRPSCVPDQHFVAKAVKATDSCQGNENTLLKVSLKAGKIVSSKSTILADKDCADTILLPENSNCWNDFDHSQNPCMTIDQTIQISKKYPYKNYEDYTCHRGILEAVSKCQLGGIEGEAKCVGIDEEACISFLPMNKDGEFHKCRKEVSEYTKCITEEFIKITNGNSDYPFKGVNCLHSYLPKRPECVKHQKKKGLGSLGSMWAFNTKKEFARLINKCKKEPSCVANKTVTFDWMKRMPYEGKWSISMLKEMMEVNTCIVNATGCNICSSTGGSVCIDQANDSGETEFIFWYETCRERWFFLGPSTSGKRNKICAQTQITELPFMEQNTQLIRDYASTYSTKKITILPLYPKPVIVMLGNTGVGKSTVANALLMGHAGNQQCFKTSSGASSQTKMTKWSKGKWLGVGHCVTVIDTPGTQDTGGKQRDYENVLNIMNILKDEVKQIDVFAVLFNGQYHRFGPGIQAALNTYEALFGATFWDHVVTEFTHWKFVNTEMKDRYVQHCRELKSKCYDEDSGNIANVGSDGSNGNFDDYDPDDCEYDCDGRRKRSVSDQNPYCKLMLEDKTSFAADTSYENIIYSNGLVTEDFWDKECGWKDLPDESQYPGGWNDENKDIYNKADFISRYVKAKSWNEKYEEKMKVTVNIPSVFINPLWNNNILGCKRFQRETNKLWNTVQNLKKPYSCSNKCEAPDSYFIGKPHIFGSDTIYIEESATTTGNPLQCSVWSGVKGTAGSVEVQWYHSDNAPLHLSDNPADTFSMKILEDDGRSSLRGGGPKNHQKLQLSINPDNIGHGDSGLYYCFLEQHSIGNKPSMERGTLVSSDMIDDALKSNVRITVNCDIFDISKEQMKLKLPAVHWYFAKKIDEQRSSKYSLSLGSEEKHDQFSVQKLIFERMDTSYQGNYACQVGGLFSDEVNVNMKVNAKWSQWGSWSPCSASCGNDRTKVKKRVCIDPMNAGLSCEALKEKTVRDGNYAEVKQISCEYACCPINGMWGNWQSWSQCSQQCYDTTNPPVKKGEKRRQRRCNNPRMECGGKDCTGKSEDVRPCNEHECPIDGGWSSWSDWSDCIKDPALCAGTMKRTRICANPAPRYGGRNCPGVDVDTQNCEPKCPVDCKASSWGEWSTCSKTCKQYNSMEFGIIKRHRGSIPAMNNGKTCPELGIHLVGTEQCTVDKICPRETIWGEWSNYGNCNSETGKKKRERSCYFKDSNMRELFDEANAYGGHGCVGDDAEDDNCPVNCRCTAQWNKWEICTEPCYKKGRKKPQRTRRRSCIPPKNNGNACTDNDTTEKEDCRIDRCGYVIDGIWGKWGAWGDCPVECGGGVQTRKRSCTFERRDKLILNGDYDDTKDKLRDCKGKGIEVHANKCNSQQCSVNSLIYVMDTSCSFDGSDQDTAKNLGKALIDELVSSQIDVPKYRVLGSPGDKDVQVQPFVTSVSDFITQYTTGLIRKQCGSQWNLKALLWALQHGANHGTVIVLFTDTGTSESNRDQLATDIEKELQNKKATIIIYITPDYDGDAHSKTLYEKISLGNVYIMREYEPTDVIGVVKRNLRRKGDEYTCIASGGVPIKKLDCKFPFKYEGVEYNKCTDMDHVQPWCSTFVDASGIHQDGKVGLCGDCSGVQDSACSGYKVLNEDHRNVKNLNRASASDIDYDRADWSGYYRFKSPAGIKLPNNKNEVRPHEAWFQGEHPEVKEKVQRKTICWDLSCSNKQEIQTITCSSNKGESFHLYALKKPPQQGYSYVAREGICPTDWVTIRTICIYISTDKGSWEVAKATCEANGGQLFEPQNENMNEKVWKYVKLAEKIDVVTHYWLAFNDKADEGDFRSSLSKYWLAGRPIDDNTVNCVNVITKSGKWTDEACSTKRHYICQRAQNS